MITIKNQIVAVVALIIAIIACTLHLSSSILTNLLGSATVTPTNYNNLTLSNQLVVGGADIRTDGAATTSIVLGLTDLQGNSTIVENSATNTAYTITLPATSTLTGWLPHLGDESTIFFVNSSTTGPTITIASSSGIVVKTASSATTGAIVGGAVAELNITRVQTQTAGGQIDVQLSPTNP